MYLLAHVIREGGSFYSHASALKSMCVFWYQVRIFLHPPNKTDFEIGLFREIHKPGTTLLGTPCDMPTPTPSSSQV